MTEEITKEAMSEDPQAEVPTELSEKPVADECASDSVAEDTTPEDGERAPQKTLPAVDYAALAAEDLLALRREFPELSALSDLTELENPARYGALRDLGLSAKEAYLATTTPRRIPRGDNRAHLHSAVPKAVQAVGDGMSEGELSAARELFFGLGDAELHRLYQKVTK